jgi:lipopolysaccharide/colanic/teichoic acid biosynthesis glycosyltransferase
MVKNADKSGVDSTSSNDMRITPVGHFIRKYKMDELSQLLNVILGDMSLVGPRPNVQRETDLYTLEEKRLLTVKPGITDFASIVFSDEGDILKGGTDPDIDYNQLIRPWKSKLGLFYISNRSLTLDIKLIFLTAIAIVSKKFALDKVVQILISLGADHELVEVSSRKGKLLPSPPPGAKSIVTNREGRVDDFS